MAEFQNRRSDASFGSILKNGAAHALDKPVAVNNGDHDGDDDDDDDE